MPVTPFSTLPLSVYPYFSRITNNLDSTNIKNYYLIGFKPAFPLQASELNEIQEQFFVQQSLSNSCVYNWQDKKNPFWPGATPLNPNYISVVPTDPLKPVVTLSSGWLYLSGMASGNLGVWIYNPTAYSFATTINTNQTLGIWVKSSLVTYTNDTGLSDNSGAGRSTAYGSVNQGADRFTLVITGTGTTAPDAESVFYPLLKTVTGQDSVFMINNYPIYTKA